MAQQKVKYTDTERTPAERARALLEEMTLDEKMAQLGCIFPFGDSYDDMEQQALEMPYGIGQVSTLEMRRIRTLEEAAGWQRKMQETVMRQSPHHIPAIFHMEGLCGAFIQEGTSFPSGIARDRVLPVQGLLRGLGTPYLHRRSGHGRPHHCR